MLWMRVSDLVRLPCAESLRAAPSSMDEANKMYAAGVGAIKESILQNGWLEDSSILICDGKVAAGLLRRAALLELLTADEIKLDFMVSVRVQRTMLIPMLVDVMGKEPPPDYYSTVTRNLH